MSMQQPDDFDDLSPMFDYSISNERVVIETGQNQETKNQNKDSDIMPDEVYENFKRKIFYEEEVEAQAWKRFCSAILRDANNEYQKQNNQFKSTDSSEQCEDPKEQITTLNSNTDQQLHSNTLPIPHQEFVKNQQNDQLVISSTNIDLSVCAKNTNHDEDIQNNYFTIYPDHGLATGNEIQPIQQMKSNFTPLLPVWIAIHPSVASKDPYSEVYTPDVSQIIKTKLTTFPDNEEIKKSKKTQNKVWSKRQTKTESDTQPSLLSCKCRKVSCLENYCTCFRAGKTCGETCRCINCENYKGSQFLECKSIFR